MLHTAFGPAIALWLEDASIVEVMLNPRRPAGRQNENPADSKSP
jgi:hypothetical protein